jgi:hypothetical protein
VEGVGSLLFSWSLLVLVCFLLVLLVKMLVERFCGLMIDWAIDGFNLLATAARRVVVVVVA